MENVGMKLLRNEAKYNKLQWNLDEKAAFKSKFSSWG